MIYNVMKKNSLQLDSVLKSARASEKHPLQTIVQFALTDYKPNKNKQAIPISEADNIIRTATGMPIKMSFDGIGPQGHAGAKPIGHITNVWKTDTQVCAEAAVWNREFKDIDAFLRSANAEEETIGTSWEMFYEDSTKDDDAVEWLHGITFAATTIVGKPAYGPERTRIFSVAEDLISDQISMTIQDLYTLISVLNEVWNEVYEKERTDQVLQNASEVIDRARSILNRVKETKKAMAELEENELTTLRAQVAELEAKRDTLEAEKIALAEFKASTERAQLLQTRAQTLKDLFTSDEIDTRKDMIISLSDSAFSAYVADLSAVAAKKPAIAEDKTSIRVPDLSGSITINVPELAKELNELRGKK